MRIGWCPGLRQVDEMLKLYLDTSAVRLFFGFRDPVPTAWAGPDLAPLGDAVLPVLSFKVWDLPAMLRLADVVPPGTVLSYHHEDEQQDGGDIPPALFISRWVELARAFASHPRRGLLRLAPIYTRYWWEKHPGDLRYWPGEVAHLLDAVGWDIYNSGATYRTPDDLLRVPREMAARTGLPYLIGELGAVRLAGDGDGQGRSAWMRDMVAAARQDGCLAVCWFHKDEWDLTGPGSAGEQQTWRELIREAASMGRWTDLAKWVGPTTNQGGAMRRHDGVVIHIAEGSYDGTIAWQRNPAADVSSHFIVAKDGRIAQMVDAETTAWTQRDGNGEWLSVENEGRLPDALTAAQVEANARILARAHQVYGVPLQVTDTPAKRGLGHHSMGAENGYNWGHSSCPGAAIKAQKAAIVNRAQQIINGEDDVVTPEDIEKVAGRTKQLVLSDGGMQQLFSRVYQLGVNVQKLLGAAGEDPVDEAAVAGEVLRVLTPAAIAAALPPEVARQVADELAARLAS